VHLNRDRQRPRIRDEARGQDALQSHAGIGVGGDALKQGDRVGKVAMPVANHAGSGSPGLTGFGLQHPPQDGFVHRIDILKRPHELDQVQVVIGILGVELSHPVAQGGYAVRGIPFTEFQSSEMAGPGVGTP